MTKAKAFIQGLPDEFLACRRLGHPWRHSTVEREGRGFIETLVCPTCDMRRVDKLDRRAHLIGRHYVPPEGYAAHHVEGLKGRDGFRLEAVTRLLDRGSEAVEGPAPVVSIQRRRRRSA